MAKVALWIPCGPLQGEAVTVTLTRIAPGTLDTGDNLSAALSAVRDGVADALRTNDRDPLVTWAYGQRRGAAREYGVEVRIECGTR